MKLRQVVFFGILLFQCTTSSLGQSIGINSQSYLILNSYYLSNTTQLEVGYETNNHLLFQMNVGSSLFSKNNPDWKAGLGVQRALVRLRYKSFAPIAILQAEYFFGYFPTKEWKVAGPADSYFDGKPHALSLTAGFGFIIDLGNWSFPLTYSMGWFTPTGQIIEPYPSSLTRNNYYDISNQFLQKVNAGVRYSFKS